MAIVKAKNIFDMAKEILLLCNLPDGDADIVADTILDAHRKGKHTHGLGRLPIYHRKIKEGLMSPKTEMEQVSDRAAVAVYDAKNGFGQVAAHKGMRICIEKASLYGIGALAIRDSNSFGAAGYYGEIAAKEGMIGIIMGNASPALATPGGRRAIFGTNPICYAFPGTDKYPPIVVDMACSVAARGKIRLAAKTGESIPIDWAVDADGAPTDDPVKAIQGMINAIGGYKGFGLALVVDVLAGLLSGAAFGGEVKALNAPEKFSRYGHFLMAIDTNAFLSKEDYAEKVDYLIKNVKKCGSPETVFLPGEQSYLKLQQNLINIELSEKIIDEINELAVQVGAIARL
jgi:L-2-hydroxycarboxylate dehydrogenase (NAD+)